MKVAINGFGRIGRLSFRRLMDYPDVEVVAINDLTDNGMLAHLLKFDTMHGRFNKKVEFTDDEFIVDGRKIQTFAEPDPSRLPWGKLGVDVVLECTGFFTDTAKAKAHIDAGAKKVLISAPAKGDDVKIIVYNVNHQTLDGSEKFVSGASCTTNCLAPMAKVMNDSFGIKYALMSTIHAFTGDQMTQDGPHRKGDKRRARAASLNIVPTTTGAAKAIGKVIPELNGKLDGSALRAPVGTGSITELYSILDKKTTIDEVNAAMKKAANESFGYNEEEIVSSDIIGMEYGSLFDATLTKILDTPAGQMVKTVSWYDNEMSYVSQLVRTLIYMGKIAK